MKPEYLDELADIADPDGLWRLSGIDQMDLSPEKRKQLDAGVALRRYSSHVKQLHQALSDRRSYLITPLSALGQIAKMIDTPADHAAYRDRRIAPTAAVDKRASKTQFDILIDKMEYANGYGGTREALFAYVRDLEARTAADEIESLRRGQAAAVMPLIGPLLDAWDGVANDMKHDEELDEVRRWLQCLSNAMENAPAIVLRAAPQDASKAPAALQSGPPGWYQFRTAKQQGIVAGDGKPCPNDHDPDCRWPQCNCRLRAAATLGATGDAQR